VAPPGSIIVARDVPQRPAFAPGQPGEVTAVETAPVDIIFGATNQIVTILSDDQAAAVNSGIAGQRSGLANGLGSIDATLNDQFGSGPGQTSAGSFAGGLGGTINSAVGAATGAIGKALTPLSSVGKGD
jgi:hypothetical protein